MRGPQNHLWKGGRIKHQRGYILVWQPDHPRANRSHVYEHILVAEQALRKPLPENATVHHVDGNPGNNTNTNLVICEQGYHMLLHARLRALKACDNPDWRPCSYCKKHDDPTAMTYKDSNSSFYHRTCNAAYEHQRKAKRK